ncbi:MAG: organomercurial lyase [Solirubrobacteraceae bacterium]
MHTIDTHDLARDVAVAMGTLDAEQQHAAVSLYRLLGEGEPVAPERVAQRAALPLERVQELLDGWPAVYRDQDGSVIGFWGLTIRDMPHRLEIGGRTLYAWCAWDTLFLPEILGGRAAVTSTCPTTGQTVSLEVDARGVHRMTPDTAVLSFLRPDGPFDGDVIRSFCHFVHFFASREAAGQWIERHPTTFTLSIDEGVELARLRNRELLGTALEEDRR